MGNAARAILLALATLAAATPGVIAAPATADVTVIRASAVHVGSGEVIEHGMVIVTGGRISAIGRDLAVPHGATEINLPDAVITPGLIDANALIEPANLIAPSRDPRHQASDDPANFAAGDPSSQQRVHRGRFLATLLQHDHAPEDCAVCDQFAAAEKCAFAAAHDDLGEGVVCAVCGYPGTLQDLLTGHTAGFVSGVRPGLVLSESSSEVVPHTHVIDSLNLRSPDFERLLRGGVTTVFASPETTSVIGPRGAIIRTGGPVRERVIDPAAAVTASISTDPFRGAVRNSPPRQWMVNANSRRPNTRMGLAWVFRKAFHDANAYAEGRPFGGADTPSDEALPVLTQILHGEVPLRVHARQQMDIESAIRLTSEFGMTFTLLEATEAYKSLEAIRHAGTPVVFGPIYVDPTGPRARTWETRESRLSTIANLMNSGITTAISAQDLREEDGLARQMMYAVRAGVHPADALKAVTQIPAQMLGLDEDLGTLETGKQADLVVWNAPPHEPGAWPLLVMINGRIVLQN